MDCTQVRNLLDGYLDTELDLVTSLDVETHLAECPDCSALLKNRQALLQAMHSSPLYASLSPKLENRIRNSLKPSRQSNRIDYWRQNILLNRAAALLVGIILTIGLFQLIAPRTGKDEALVQEVVSSHIRSLMVDHLSDVVSTDQHTVKPWFDGKLDFAPVVINLAEQGFPLIGGRIDYLDNRPVTALVYQRNKHIINLFIWPSSDVPNNGSIPTTLEGYHVVHWTYANMSYWAVSDIEVSELETFAQLIQENVAKQ